MPGYLKQVWIWLWDWSVYVLPAVSNLILVLLGVIMSLPALAERVERTPRYRKILAAACLLFGLIGFGFDVSQRRTGDRLNKQLLTDVGASLKNTNELVQKTTSLVASTNEMVGRLGLLEPQISTVNDRLATIDKKIDTAKKDHDQGLVAALQAERETSLSTLLSMTPGIVSELRYWASKCDKDDATLEARQAISATEQERQETMRRRADLRTSCSQQVQPLMRSASYVREELVRRLHAGQTQEDAKISSIFARAIAGDAIYFQEIGISAAYLEGLARRFTAEPPSGVSVTIQ